MKKCTLAAWTLALAAVARADQFAAFSDITPEGAYSKTMTVTADRVAADRNSQALMATGHVLAVSMPTRMHTDFLERDTNGVCRMASGSSLTTCTNCQDRLHWELRGEIEYQENDHAVLRDVTMRLFDVPVFWLPYLYYPMGGEFGLQMMVGYTSRWGAFFQSKVNYDIIGDSRLGPDAKWLHGNTRFDLRWENGVAFGESLKWSLGDWGQGHVKAYYAWDRDYDRYGTTYDGSSWNYMNWGSTVPENRWGVELRHSVELTERDTLRGHATIFSDTFFRGDFLRSVNMGIRNDFEYNAGNEVAWEHQESVWALGASISGPVRDFEGGTGRLPEFYFDVAPTPIWSLPANYESQTRIGYLTRRYAEYGSGVQTAFSHNPGLWAEYDTFRFDTYHRIDAPFKLWDALAVDPRVAYRGTYWNDSGYTSVSGVGEAVSTGEHPFRSIIEGGITFAGRGTAWIDEKWQHMVEPYADVLAQQAVYAGLSDGTRPYVFDSLDASTDWSDQFAGRSRNLPYSYYGVTPGVRNALRAADERGSLRTILDVDVYAALQFNSTTYTFGSDSHKLAEPGKPNHDATAIPGARARWLPSKDTILFGRIEYDSEYNAIALASVGWTHRLSKKLKYYITYNSRDHRWWDFSSTPVTGSYYDGFNWAKFSYVETGFEHEVCDAFAWAPYIRWDCRVAELDEVGAWIDFFRTDCLGFRFIVAYENEYTRVDGSLEEEQWRAGFYIYLRALGPGTGLGVGD